jgi:hypothetical protein
MQLTPFEYVTVLISIIMGMGITQIRSGLANIILPWEQVKIYWPHFILVILVFIIHIQEWWVKYDLRSYQYWRLPTFLFIVLYPVNLYILARILFPIKWGTAEYDLKVFYFANYRKIYLFSITLAILAIIDNVFMMGFVIKDQIIQLFLLVVLSIVTVLKRKEEWIHKLIAFLLFVASIDTFVVTWDTFLIMN